MSTITITITADQLRALNAHRVLAMPDTTTIAVQRPADIRHTHPLYVAAQVQAQALIAAGDAGGELVHISEAARIIGLHSGMVSKWESAGYCPAQGKDKNRVLVKLVDVLYCKSVYDERPGSKGAPLLNEDGTPYKVKRPQSSR